MPAADGLPFVSVKFEPVGRVQTFLLPDLAFDPPLAPGEAVVVQTSEGPACATVKATPTAIAERKLPLDPPRVVRRASREDIVRRLKH